MAKVWLNLRSPDSSDQAIRKINLKRILHFLEVKRGLICKDTGLFNLIKTIEEELLSKWMKWRINSTDLKCRQDSIHTRKICQPKECLLRWWCKGCHQWTLCNISKWWWLILLKGIWWAAWEEVCQGHHLELVVNKWTLITGWCTIQISKDKWGWTLSTNSITLNSKQHTTNKWCKLNSTLTKLSKLLWCQGEQSLLKVKFLIKISKQLSKSSRRVIHPNKCLWENRTLLKDCLQPQS